MSCWMDMEGVLGGLIRVKGDPGGSIRIDDLERAKGDEMLKGVERG